MKKVHYSRGDATTPNASKNKIICHICNDIGAWGKGFVTALSKKWSSPEAAYRKWYQQRNQNDFKLGSIQLIRVEEDIWVANMIAQHKIRTNSVDSPIRYFAVESCLELLRESALQLSASIHMPRIGCGLAGGNWNLIEPIISDQLSSFDISVTVYDLPETDHTNRKQPRHQPSQ